VRRSSTVGAAQAIDRVLDDFGGMLLEPYAGVGRLSGQLGGECRAEHAESVVGGQQCELAVARGGIEMGGGREDAFDVGQRERAPVDELHGEWGEHVAVAGAGQQFVAEMATQLCQRGAEGRLAEVHPCCGPGDAAFAQ
jgi:hypothetical protein